MDRSDTRPIGVFDSGIGGLSILRELQTTLPRENYIFLADQMHIPYGEKTGAHLERLAAKATRFLLSHAVKMVVVACNTATCYAIGSLRRDFSIPFVGTVPAVKPAVRETRSGVIAVISTPATARSLALRKLVLQYASGTAVLRIGCPGLEDAVESGNIHSPKTAELLEKYMSKIRKSGADHIVLGCTHYPFLKDSITEIMGPSVRLVDSGQAIARRTSALLADKNIANTSRTNGKTYYFTTGDPRRFSRVASRLLSRRIRGQKAII